MCEGLSYGVFILDGDIYIIYVCPSSLGFIAESLKSRKQSRLNAEKKFMQIILYDLFKKGYEWTVIKPDSSMPSDNIVHTPNLSININDEKYKTWSFDFRTSEFDIIRMYGLISTLELPQDTKFIIAVDNEESLLKMRSNPPKSLKANVFIMLFDFGSEKIIKEEMLCLC